MVQQFTGLAAQLQSELPLNYTTLDLSSSQRVGLVIVNEVNGFCTVGAGNMAPRAPSKPISDMVEETSIIAKKFSERGWPILAFLDTHEPDKPEVPYPPHCIVGTGEENLVPDLAWLEQDEHTLLMRKDCVDAFIGAFQKDGTNVVVEWIKKHQVEMMLVVGICTDISVLDFAKTVISARNHDMLDPLKHVAVYSKGCATYDLPVQVAKDIGGISHPQEIFHYLGLYLVATRGAIVVNTLHFMESAENTSSHDKVRVVWDEQNLAFLEANRTPKQKINEPKTPYHAPEAEDGLVSPKPDDECTLMADAVHAEAIRHALSEVAASSIDEAGCSRTPPQGSGWTSSEDEAEEMDHDVEGDFDHRAVSALPPGGPFRTCGNMAAYGTSFVDLIANRIHGWTPGTVTNQIVDYIGDGFESNGRRWSFEERRRAHYDEYRKAKMLHGQDVNDEDDNHTGEHHRDRHLSVGSGSGPNQDQESNLSRSLSGIDLDEAQV